MNLLLVDVGNSRTKVVQWSAAGGGADDLLVLLETDTPRDDPGATDLAIAVGKLGNATVGVTSVVPAVSSALLAAVPRALLVDHTWTFPFAVDVEHPDTVGADRWCNAAAAVDAGFRDAIVVDVGTATTIDVLDGGIFRGGLIAPGMAFAARRLQEAGARLWEVDFGPRPLRPGRTTEEALAVGGFHVGVNGVTTTIEQLQRQYPDAQVVITGGLGHHVARGDWYADPHLVFRGLAVLTSTRAAPEGGPRG